MFVVLLSLSFTGALNYSDMRTQLREKETSRESKTRDTNFVIYFYPEITFIFEYYSINLWKNVLFLLTVRYFFFYGRISLFCFFTMGVLWYVLYMWCFFMYIQKIVSWWIEKKYSALQLSKKNRFKTVKILSILYGQF